MVTCTSLAPAIICPPTKVNHASPITTAAMVPVRRSKRASNKSPVVSPFTASAQRLTFGTMKKETMIMLSPEIAINHEPAMPSVKPSPPIAMLKPPPISVAAVEAVVCTRFMLRSAARNDSLSPPSFSERATLRPIPIRTMK